MSRLNTHLSFYYFLFLFKFWSVFSLKCTGPWCWKSYLSTHILRRLCWWRVCSLLLFPLVYVHRCTKNKIWPFLSTTTTACVWGKETRVHNICLINLAPSFVQRRAQNKNVGDSKLSYRWYTTLVQSRVLPGRLLHRGCFHQKLTLKFTSRA